MALFTTRPVGDAMVTTFWGSSTSWTLTALPLFIWMAEILLRTRLSEDMFRALATLLHPIPVRLPHTNVIGCPIFPPLSVSLSPPRSTLAKVSNHELHPPTTPETPT